MLYPLVWLVRIQRSRRNFKFISWLHFCNNDVEKYAGVAAPEGIVAVSSTTPAAEAIPVKKVPTFTSGKPKMTRIEIICKESKLKVLKNNLMSIGITGMTVSHVLGCGIQKG